jgi:hypothetical protein
LLKFAAAVPAKDQMSMTIDKSGVMIPPSNHAVVHGETPGSRHYGPSQTIFPQSLQCAVFYQVVVSILHRDQRGATPDTIATGGGVAENGKDSANDMTDSGWIYLV